MGLRDYIATRTPLYRQPGEMGRRTLGFVGNLAAKLYGASGAAGVITGDGETWGGKAWDAIASVPDLYQKGKQILWVMRHRQEIQEGIQFAHEHMPQIEDLERIVERSRSAMEGYARLSLDVEQAREAAQQLNIFNFPSKLSTIYVNLDQIAERTPDVDVVQGVVRGTDVAVKAVGYLDQVREYIEPVYQTLMNVADNFSDGEAFATTAVAVGFLGAWSLAGYAIGFWARRGQPGIFTRWRQDAGAYVFRKWYGGKRLEDTLGNLTGPAREHFQLEAAADPERVLNPEAYHKLERHFEEKRAAAAPKA